MLLYKNNISMMCDIQCGLLSEEERVRATRAQVQDNFSLLIQNKDKNQKGLDKRQVKQATVERDKTGLQGNS